jgi:phosphoenolpyruvate carboxykinase (ATP)
MVKAALTGALNGIPCTPDPIFHVSVPAHVPGVPDQVLDARATWPDRGAYEVKARELARLFAANFERFSATASADIKAAAPLT